MVGLMFISMWRQYLHFGYNISFYVQEMCATNTFFRSKFISTYQTEYDSTIDGHRPREAEFIA